jgi:membrane-bound lytic murein transglycosylase B
MVDIPARALVAYGNAELVLRSVKPKCRLSWATLAGIGRIESHHGQYGGAVLGADGRPSKPIIGVPLGGSPGVKAIGDTDGGRLDGDPSTDRAVGPMQFIPSTWAKYASDGNEDVADPRQIDDAAFAAARYLCANGRDERVWVVVGNPVVQQFDPVRSEGIRPGRRLRESSTDRQGLNRLN